MPYMREQQFLRERSADRVGCEFLIKQQADPQCRLSRKSLWLSSLKVMASLPAALTVH